MADTEKVSLDDLLSDRVINEEGMQRIIAALEAKGVTLPCPRCGNEDFSIVDGYFVHSIQKNLKSISLGGGKAIPTIGTICTNCGYLSEHALGSLGLLPQGD